VILNGIGDSGNQLHTTAGTSSGTIGANIVVHRTGVDQILLRIWDRWGLGPPDADAQENQDQTRRSHNPIIPLPGFRGAHE
jgi:hypothetical protein